jgi:hypothetical protein
MVAATAAILVASTSSPRATRASTASSSVSNLATRCRRRATSRRFPGGGEHHHIPAAFKAKRLWSRVALALSFLGLWGSAPDRNPERSSRTLTIVELDVPWVIPLAARFVGARDRVRHGDSQHWVLSSPRVQRGLGPRG